MKDYRTEIAITKDGEDYIRIIPRLKDGNQLELVFVFLCQDFIIRDYTIEKQEDFRMIYDIRTEQAAAYTLNRLTGISDSLWRQNAYRERDFECIDYYVDAMINDYGTKQLPQSYMDMEYIYFHVTTSGNECRSIQKYGILDLKNAYECRESELRMFLDENDVFIDLDRAVEILDTFIRPFDMEKLIKSVSKYMDKVDTEETKKSILIVDDDITYMRTVYGWLKNKYRVGMASSGIQAISWLAKNKADLILLDYQMLIFHNIVL